MRTVFHLGAALSVVIYPPTVAEAMRDLMSLDLREDVARLQSPALVLGTWKRWPRGFYW